MTHAPLLDVHNLSLAYRTRAGLQRVLREVSFTLAAGQTLGIVGESGSGKSQLALALMGLLPAHAEVSGAVSFEGQALLTLDERARRQLRGGRMGMIFQDPMTCLNPHLTIGLQLAEVLEQHRGSTRAQALAAARQMLDAVRIPEAARRLRQYPHELSGGQRQRVMIAMMLLARPALLIADEPTTALDVTVQAEILQLLAALQREMGLALLLVSHDLGVMSDIADTLLVLYAGQAMEQGDAAAILATPQHPYTRALLACRPRLDSIIGAPLVTIGGAPPRAGAMSSGCAFAPRCHAVHAPCQTWMPAAALSSRGVQSRCHLTPS